MLEHSLVILALAAGALLACLRGKLTPAGAVAAALTGILVYAGSGYAGICMLVVFFILGTLATATGKSRKKDAPERRNAGQVFANGGLAAFLSLLAFAEAGHHLPYPLMIAAALASAAADTVSSELGTLYGKRFFNVVTFKRDANGLDGVISLEGTLSGVCASAVVAVTFGLFEGFGMGIWIIIVAGTIGNFADSMLGATLERNGTIGNDAVNFLNTTAAALAAWGLASLYRLV
ncbi:DUF92 domain-containing protein [Chitinophaga lutea]